MRGHRLFNFPSFDRARDELKAKGFEVVSPADIDREGGFNPEDIDPLNWNPHDAGRWMWEEYNPESITHYYESKGLEPPKLRSLDQVVRDDLEQVQKADCLYMLTGWENSKGAQAEHAVAEWLNKVIIYE